MADATVTFSTLDWLLVLVFVGVVAALGIITKLKSESALSYIVAGRSLSVPAFVATLVVTWYGGVLGIGESVAVYGVGTWLLFGVPYYAFGIFYALFMADKVRSSDQISIPERLEAKYGTASGAIGAALVFMLAAPAAQVYMLGVLLSVMTGLHVNFCVILGAGIGAAFLFRGGLLADVRMSIVAFCSVYVGFVVIDFLSAMHGTPLAIARGSGHPELMDWTGQHGPLAILSFFVLGAWTMVDPGFHQRVNSTAAPGTARKGVLIAVACFIVSDILTISCGLYALGRLHPLPHNLDEIFPLFADKVLPSGLKGLFFIGLFAISLASLVGYTLICGTTFGRDIIGRFKKYDDAKTVLWARIGLVVSGLVAVAVALLVHSVVDIWYSWAGALVGALLVPTVAAYWKGPGADRPKTSNWGTAGSILAGFFVAIGWWIYAARTGNPEMNVPHIDPKISLGTLVPAAVVTGLGMAITAPFASKGLK